MDFFAFDKAYLDRLRNGDPATEHHFFTYFERFLNIKLRARALRSDNVEDLKQETLLRTISAVRKDSVREPERFGAFVNSICKNVLLEFYRSSAGNKPPNDGHMGTSNRADEEDTIITNPSADQVRDVLEGMPERDRELLRAIFMEEKEKNAVCKEMGVDRDYLRVLLHRAKLAFRINPSLALTILKEDTRQVTPPPGATLYSIAQSICSKKTMEEIVCPLVADIQFEYREAFCAGRNWRATWVRVRGWWSFLAAIGVNRILNMFVRLFLRSSSR